VKASLAYLTVWPGSSRCSVTNGDQTEHPKLQLDSATGVSERVRKLPGSEAMVDEEDEIVRLVARQPAAPGAPTGSPRVCPQAAGRSPRPDSRAIRRRRTGLR